MPHMFSNMYYTTLQCITLAVCAHLRCSKSWLLSFRQTMMTVSLWCTDVGAQTLVHRLNYMYMRLSSLYHVLAL